MKRSTAIAALFLAAIICLGFVHPFGDPRVEPAKGLDTLLRGANMPAPAKSVLIAKCADCHSSETRWPVYSRVAPASWLVERDIVEARKAMDLSHWEELPTDRQELLKARIIQEARSGAMPPLQYLAVHWTAKLSPADIQALSTLRQTGTGSEAESTESGDPSLGKAVFEKRCTGCHAVAVDREGPRLAGVYGRKAGSVPGFSYSAGLKASGVTWDNVSLEKWLSDPDLMVPDNQMSFSVPKARERRDLIAFLKQLH